MNPQSDVLSELCDFLYPRSPYCGQFKPEYLDFNANLQEFSQRVNYICALQTNGKISPEEAYKQIHLLWKQLKQAKKTLVQLEKGQESRVKSQESIVTENVSWIDVSRSKTMSHLFVSYTALKPIYAF